jgi:hypothetical protein
MNTKVVNATSAVEQTVRDESFRWTMTTNVAAALQVVATAFVAFYAGRAIGMFSATYGTKWQRLNAPWNT